MKLNTKGIRNILMYLAAILAIVLLGGIYILAAWWLIDGLFGVTFTVWQTTRIVALVWLTVKTVKYMNGIKVEK